MSRSCRRPPRVTDLKYGGPELDNQQLYLSIYFRPFGSPGFLLRPELYLEFKYLAVVARIAPIFIKELDFQLLIWP